MEGHEYEDKSTGPTEGQQVPTEDYEILEGVTSTTGQVRFARKGQEYNRKSTGHSKGSLVWPEENGGTQRAHEYDWTVRAHRGATSKTWR